MTSPTTFRVRAITVAVISATAMLLTGCSLLGSSDAPRDASGTPTAAKTDADVFSIQVGDCLNDATSQGTVTTAPIVPCSQPHDSEAFMAFVVAGDKGAAYPGETAVTSEASTDCGGAFQKFVGIAYDDSSLKISYYYPTAESWKDRDDRQIMCTIYDDGVKTTGTLKDAKR